MLSALHSMPGHFSGQLNSFINYTNNTISVGTFRQCHSFPPALWTTVVTVMFTLVLAMSTTSQWMAPHQLPLLRYHQKRAPLPVVNSGTMVYAIDSGRIYNFDFRAGNPTFAIDINPTKLNPCQSVQIQIADGGCSGDTYSVLLDGIELGKTSPAKSLTCTLTTANGTVIDMTDPSRQTTMLFPGVLWDTKWSSGRFNIPPGQHVIEIQSVTKVRQGA